ncbi:DNA-binding transcriptional regulator, MarR family [Chryseobacterium carnipullorum]|nr:DNA-binding transcriptional regulator, MarR family [Chryseobacterium carnipullorum]
MVNYLLVKNLIELSEIFENQNKSRLYDNDINGFLEWTNKEFKTKVASKVEEPDWEGKEEGRTPESVISTLLVHLNRYAKMYSKSAISGSGFTTQEDFIYLINLKAFGAMTKTELIKKNIHDKPVGNLIINRLIKQGWVEQCSSSTDKRAKVIKITEKGLLSLENQMHKIRQATHIVTGDLHYSEKMELIRILDKLDKFHHPIFSRNIDADHLIDRVYSEYPVGKN